MFTVGIEGRILARDGEEKPIRIVGILVALRVAIAAAVRTGAWRRF